VRLVFAEPAATDLEDIIEYIALDDRRAAEAVYRAIVAATELLLAFPALGHPGRLPGTREYSITGLPYIVVYEADTTTVTVLAVFHGARDLRRALATRRKDSEG
jgi:toxin ParE1/3/4